MSVLHRLFDRTRTLRFMIVGVGAAALLFTLSWLFVSGGVPPFLGSTLAYAIAFVVAYSAQRNWTFGAAHGHGHAFPRYFTLQAVCALLSGVGAHVAVVAFHASPFVMSASTVIVASAASYIGSVFWVFPETRHAR